MGILLQQYMMHLHDLLLLSSLNVIIMPYHAHSPSLHRSKAIFESLPLPFAGLLQKTIHNGVGMI
jgi:hypothetical protein